VTMEGEWVFWVVFGVTVAGTLWQIAGSIVRIVWGGK
jgi:hypothetical protein